MNHMTTSDDLTRPRTQSAGTYGYYRRRKIVCSIYLLFSRNVENILQKRCDRQIPFSQPDAICFDSCVTLTRCVFLLILCEHLPLY